MGTEGQDERAAHPGPPASLSSFCSCCLHASSAAQCVAFLMKLLLIELQGNKLAREGPAHQPQRRGARPGEPLRFGFRGMKRVGVGST